MRARLIALAVLIGTNAPLAAMPASAEVRPGLYEITVRIELPNVEAVAAPTRTTRCLGAAALARGTAFGVLSRNPLSACPHVETESSAGEVRFRIVCPGANAPTASARFAATDHGFRGVIHMNMGGKNMTMTERQTGRRVSDCP